MFSIAVIVLAVSLPLLLLISPSNSIAGLWVCVLVPLASVGICTRKTGLVIPPSRFGGMGEGVLCDRWCNCRYV